MWGLGLVLVVIGGAFALGELHYLLLARTTTGQLVSMEEKFPGRRSRSKQLYVVFAYTDPSGVRREYRDWMPLSWTAPATFEVEYVTLVWNRARIVRSGRDWQLPVGLGLAAAGAITIGITRRIERRRAARA